MQPFKKERFHLYIQYTMDQLYLLMDVEDDIPFNPLVTVVHEAVYDRIFQAAYPGGGRMALTRP
ncbi:hypothetical protein JJQ72_05075 [Paenibacillus sp. F411]|uniref:hypothetical protein n=1 Tax=Paenibacillus sp. F411 TaxID=2820239 RepID=UPI001AAECF82|nr:hypothetical protein [Paenibacillus sp. F411]MBO2943354.1 hypothetical protein [Paenibacillus sp. F411]